MVNPFDTDETSEALRMALDMPLDERKQRWAALMKSAQKYNVDDWAVSFLNHLTQGGPDKASATRDVLYLGSASELATPPNAMGSPTPPAA